LPFTSAVADADDVELLLVAFRHPEHGVRDQAARKPVELRELRRIGRPLRVQVAVGDLEADAGGMRLPELPFRPLHFDRALGDLHGHALRDGDGFLSDTRHF